MIMAAVEQPDFVRHARSVGAQRIVIALHVHDALSQLFFLAHHIAENAALFVFEPFVRGTQLVFNAAGNKYGGRNLGVGVGPLFSGE